jgi:rhamnose transport system ATP-binding protein
MTAAAPTVAAVELTRVSKRFGATGARRRVGDLRSGEIRGLVGENGAGKSTLVKILAGVHQPDEGSIFLGGVPTLFHGPADSRARGIAVVHQEPRLFPDLSVAENVFLGHAPSGRFGTISWREMRRGAVRLFEDLDVRLDPTARVRGLSMADQQLIEIAKALSVEASVLVLDEPTASLSLHEVDRLFAIVRRLRDRGVAVLFVSHRLDEVFELCDQATILRDGRLVVSAPTSELTTADLIRHMVGRNVTLFPKAVVPLGEVLLRVDGLTRAGEFHDIGFSVRAGGCSARRPGGRSDRGGARALRDRPTGCRRIELAGSGRVPQPVEAVKAGFAYVPETGTQNGLCWTSVALNVTLPIMPRLFPRLFVDRGTERRLATTFTDELRVRMTGIEQPASALSGGNQQKVVLAKWLATKPRVLILDEPTRGIDIGAKAEVHRIISDLAASGLAIILISSDLPEVLAMSDRIIVLHEGRITAEIGRDEATEERVMYAATGQDHEAGAGAGAHRGGRTVTGPWHRAAGSDRRLRQSRPTIAAQPGKR